MLFKARVFLQIFFPRNLLVRKVLRTSVFLKSNCLTFLCQFISLLKSIVLKASNKRIHIPLLIKIDKIPTQIQSIEQRMKLVKAFILSLAKRAFAPKCLAQRVCVLCFNVWSTISSLLTGIHKFQFIESNGSLHNTLSSYKNIIIRSRNFL